jgi:hypothetical protein
MQDAPGSTRAVLNHNSTNSTVIARRDYLPFGKEIGAGTGLATTAHTTARPKVRPSASPNVTQARTWGKAPLTHDK